MPKNKRVCFKIQIKNEKIKLLTVVAFVGIGIFLLTWLKHNQHTMLENFI
jgi:hypothetical protein